MTQPNLKQLAQQGNIKAISTLMNRTLQAKGITAKVRLKESCLQVMLESTQIPDQQFCVALIAEGMQRLAIPSIQSLRIFGRQDYDQLIGGFVHFLGFLLYVLAIAAGFYFASHTNQTQQKEG